MNRFARQISAACLFTALALPTAPAFARKVKNQHEKKIKQNPLADVNSKQPDKELFDKAMKALSKGRYDVTRLDLQVLLNTYPDSEYLMRAKLAVADSWFKEGGSAAYTQAESEYHDFITFFPNSPEAAEAQMRVADIYYMQMEKPDRDYTNVQRAEQEYRVMIQTYPDSTLLPRAKQRLRDVQEVLAQREYEIGQFYATQALVSGNFAAGIARLQTVADTYPLFSHSDLTLIALGDSYAEQARLAQGLKISPAARERLSAIYEDRAAEAYSRVVTRYPMAPHVEDAKDRLIALNRPVPEPTPQALAENEAEEQSRTPVKLKDRAIMLVKKGPSPVTVSRVGEPSLTDPAPVLAPQINAATLASFTAATTGRPAPPTNVATAPAAESGTTTGGGETGTMQAVPDSTETSSPGTTGIGVQVITPSQNSNPAPETAIPASTGGAGVSSQPAANVPGTMPRPGDVSTGAAAEPAQPAVAPPAALAVEPNGGLKAVGPADNTPLPAVERASEAPAQINEAHGGGPAQVTTGTPSANVKKKKTPKPAFNSSDESSSKHKKKKGLSKLNPL
ncbi:MAG TPA: outer membrane protein assembly factor BamD [Acidisarcina sp.]